MVRCHKCKACKRADCGKCQTCRNKSKFGTTGGTQGGCCIHRKCSYMRPACTTSTKCPTKKSAAVVHCKTSPRTSKTTVTTTSVRKRKKSNRECAPGQVGMLQQRADARSASSFKKQKRLRDHDVSKKTGRTQGTSETEQQALNGLAIKNPDDFKVGGAALESITLSDDQSKKVRERKILVRIAFRCFQTMDYTKVISPFYLRRILFFIICSPVVFILSRRSFRTYL
jgi:hypothetical protein